jgi:hypothetical protein
LREFENVYRFIEIDGFREKKEIEKCAEIREPSYLPSFPLSIRQRLEPLTTRIHIPQRSNSDSSTQERIDDKTISHLTSPISIRL